jgi:hypothetical protein
MWASSIQLLVRAKRCKRVGRTWPNAERLLDAPLLALRGVREEVLIGEKDPWAAPMAPDVLSVLLVVVGRVAAVLAASPKALASMIPVPFSEREWATHWATTEQHLGVLQHQYPLRLRRDQSRLQLQAPVRPLMVSPPPGVWIEDRSQTLLGANHHLCLYQRMLACRVAMCALTCSVDQKHEMSVVPHQTPGSPSSSTKARVCPVLAPSVERLRMSWPRSLQSPC